MIDQSMVQSTAISNNCRKMKQHFKHIQFLHLVTFRKKYLISIHNFNKHFRKASCFYAFHCQKTHQNNFLKIYWLRLFEKWHSHRILNWRRDNRTNLISNFQDTENAFKNWNYFTAQWYIGKHFVWRISDTETSLRCIFTIIASFLFATPQK